VKGDEAEVGDVNSAEVRRSEMKWSVVERSEVRRSGVRILILSQNPEPDF
jgi:hypothetical protein